MMLIRSETNYNATMKDDKGVYFSSPSPLLAKDPLLGAVFRTGAQLSLVEG